MQRGAPTFDYVVGLHSAREVVAALEVHSAASSHVDKIVEKKKRTEQFLADHNCVRCRIDRWIWLPTGVVAIRTPIPARIFLADNDIEWPVSHVDLRALADEPPRP